MEAFLFYINSTCANRVASAIITTYNFTPFIGYLLKGVYVGGKRKRQPVCSRFFYLSLLLHTSLFALTPHITPVVHAIPHADRFQAMTLSAIRLRKIMRVFRKTGLASVPYTIETLIKEYQ